MAKKTETKQAAAVGSGEAWLETSMPPGFFAAMRDEPEAVAILGRELATLKTNRHLVLADRPKSLIMAARNTPGSLYEALTLRAGPQRAISYAMFAHSEACIPGLKETLEIQRFEFDCKPDAEIAAGLEAGVDVPADVRAPIFAVVKKSFPDFEVAAFDRLLRVFWLNNPNHTRHALPRRLAQRLLSLHQCESGGLSLEIEPIEGTVNESRVAFSVASPPQRGFLAQMMEVFNRLDFGITGASVLQVSTGAQHYAVNTFYVRPRNGERLVRGTPLDAQLRRELFNTQILDANSPEYENVVGGRMSGEDTSLVRAFVAFCHTNLGHAQPDRFDWEEVQNAFAANPQLVQQLVQLFRLRFDPGLKNREQVSAKALEEAERAVKNFNTGHKHLDDLRRIVFRCCLSFIRNTLKTNFFVGEKQAFAFRLSPSYLAELGPEFTNDLPSETPYRVTFFFTRDGFGYHIGFSDIARGGWRTVICRTDDDFLTNASTIFRENFVLAHTQHLKNKDIYEGGSKLVMLMDASDLAPPERNQELRRLYKLQRAVINAFLDLFVTKDGVAASPLVVDYYREDEPIELGPDENMHDGMIEEIAQISRRRGYLLGIGVMSSKEVGINHKEYAVTSTGVVTFTAITMKELGINIRKDPFSVKFTGGPNGDVAGNAMNLMLARCPKMEIRLILDGTAALVDPKGADHQALQDIVLKKDLDAFDPKALHVGGSMLFRTGNRKVGLKEQYRKVTKTSKGLVEEWLSVDDFSREFGDLIFTVQADLFIPGGGRPETIDKDNWQRFMLPDGTPSSKAIIEGANSFITPAARIELQKKGIIVMRDASANKCGVISSSYEIIANLTLSEEEFLKNKKRYVKGVLEILERRASDEANLIFRRRRETGKPYTEISDAISVEINTNYARLFKFFQARPELALQQPWRKAITSHLPTLLREDPRFKDRLTRLPQKYRSAILAAEIGSSMVYRGGQDSDFEDTIRLHVERTFAS